MRDVEAAQQPLLEQADKLAAEAAPVDEGFAARSFRARHGRLRRTGASVLTALLVIAALGAAQYATLPLLCGWAPGRCGQQQQPQPDEYPQFLVVGDWGREGDFNQSRVAAAMARKADSMRVDFVISTGDNFYPAGISSPADPAFAKSFTRIYHQPSLQVPWHAVLGNHDYGEADDPRHPDCGGWDPDCFYSPLHQLDIRLAQRDPRWHCERSFRLGLAAGRVDIFFIDTTPLMAEYDAVPWRGNRGGLLEQSWEGQLRELEVQLARSQAAWKLVVGHHPIRTNHRAWHAYPEMVEHLEPLLTRYGVQAYFNGHDHNLQHIHRAASHYHQICSGAGSKVGPEFHGRKHSPFQYGANGFVAVRMGPGSMAVEYMGIDSDQPLFTIDIPLRP